MRSWGCFLCFGAVIGLCRGFTPSTAVGNGPPGIVENAVDRPWDPVEPGDSYYPGHRLWSSAPGPPAHHYPPSYSVTVPPIKAPSSSCWTTPSLLGTAVLAVFAVGGMLALKLPAMILGPVVLTLFALPLALPLLAPLLALAFFLPVPFLDDSDNNSPMMMMMPSADSGPNPKPANGSQDPTKDDGMKGRAATDVWTALNDESQRCLQRIACHLGSHGGDTGLWIVERLRESGWTSFREAYIDGSRSRKHSSDAAAAAAACRKFKCSAKGTLAIMRAAATGPETL